MWPFFKVFEFSVCFKLWTPYIILNLHGQKENVFTLWTVKFIYIHSNMQLLEHSHIYS
jgi:hypothetical protein